jgi:hypothetical protein
VTYPSQHKPDDEQKEHHTAVAFKEVFTSPYLNPQCRSVARSVVLAICLWPRAISISPLRAIAKEHRRSTYPYGFDRLVRKRTAMLYQQPCHTTNIRRVQQRMEAVIGRSEDLLLGLFWNPPLCLVERVLLSQYIPEDRQCLGVLGVALEDVIQISSAGGSVAFGSSEKFSIRQEDNVAPVFESRAFVVVMPYEQLVFTR